MKLVFVGLFLIATIWQVAAQSNPSDIAVASDDFENSFYEAVKQKGIENYDKAIVALEKCLVIQPKNENILFELGKNYLFQKDYKKAYDSFENATKINPKNRWFWHGMYDVCYKTQDYTQAIILVETLIPFDAGYKEDLVSLYMKTEQFDKALIGINDLNATVGKSDKRDVFKAQILTKPEYQGAERANLLAEIQKNPKEEANYLALISLYNKNNQEKEALAIAKKLELEIPDSDWAQINLFKVYLVQNEGQKAVQSMDKVFSSNKIDSKIKHRMLNEFLIFTKSNPQFDADLERVISYFKGDATVKVAKEIGKFYQNKQDFTKAIKFYELDLQSNPNDVESNMLLLEMYKMNKSFELILQKTNTLIDLFPLQPQFYYYNGLANNQLKNHSKAKEQLLSGIDFVVDDLDLEINFNIQLGEAYFGLGDTKNKEIYFKKADKLLQQKKS
jgi:tetratricopeptide (TPR) repeat protein